MATQTDDNKGRMASGDGQCVVCGRPVAEHYNRDQTWRGCGSVSQFMVMVPMVPVDVIARAYADQVRGRAPEMPPTPTPAQTRATAHERGQRLRTKLAERMQRSAPPAPAVTHARSTQPAAPNRPPMRMPTYVYSVRDKRRVASSLNLTVAMQDAYNALRAADKPLTVREVAVAAGRPLESVRTRLGLLVERGLVARHEAPGTGASAAA